MAGFSITVPDAVQAAKLLKGDYSLQYWHEMTKPGMPQAMKVFPPGGTILTIGAGSAHGITLRPGERGVVWGRDATYAIFCKLVVGDKRYKTSSDPSWIDPEPGTIRSRPSTYSPPGTTSADPDNSTP